MTISSDLVFFEERFWTKKEVRRLGDVRDSYQRDRARIIHSAAFRRLQGKTQVMGVGEGDFHRTRLTHSIECAQIGGGIRHTLETNGFEKSSLTSDWFPSRDLIEGACLAHDLGHPPFGHGGEKALHAEMLNCGGFEGNGQTLRILARLEKLKAKGQGLDPTRRMLLAILKYPAPYSSYESEQVRSKPPKCYFDEEQEIVDWAIAGFSKKDRTRLRDKKQDGKPKYRSFDCSLMELADDIAYGIHDIEDIVARGLAKRDEVEAQLKECLQESITDGEGKLSADVIAKQLFQGPYERKQIVGALVNAFISKAEIQAVPEFEHPLLANRVGYPNH